MPVIIDTNSFANVFSTKAAKYDEFSPVKNWILSGRGMIVYGGSKYLQELSRATKYAKLFRLLRDSGKAVVGNKNNIDAIESEIYKNNTDKLFNDAHLVAISIDTKCKIICSEDVTSIPYVTNKKYYPKKFDPPVYYTSKRNSNLLCDNYIHEDLKPLFKINKERMEVITKSLEE